MNGRYQQGNGDMAKTQKILRATNGVKFIVMEGHGTKKNEYECIHPLFYDVKISPSILAMHELAQLDFHEMLALNKSRNKL